MDQYQSYNHLVSKMEAYIINKQMGNPKDRLKAKVMKKAIGWVKEYMANITQLTIPEQPQPVVQVVQCRMYTASEGTGMCTGMSPSNLAYEQCLKCPLFADVSKMDSVEEECPSLRNMYGKARCMATREMEECYCDGHKSKCTFYPDHDIRAEVSESM